jgi:hypothetical protein
MVSIVLCVPFKVQNIFDFFFDGIDIVVGQFLPLLVPVTDIGQLITDGLSDFGVSLQDVFQREFVQQTFIRGDQCDNLLEYLYGLILRLLKNLANPTPSLKLLFGTLVQLCPKARKVFQFFKLRIRQAKIPGDATLGRQRHVRPATGFSFTRKMDYPTLTTGRSPF